MANAQRIRAHLRARDIETWLDVEGIVGGEKWKVTIKRAIESCTLASAGSGGRVRLWNVASRRAAGQPLAHDRPAAVLGLAFSADGTSLASYGTDLQVRLWDPLLWRGDEGAQRARACAAGRRSLRLLASATADTTVRIWDVATRSQVGAPLRGHAKAVFGVALSADGSLVASGGRDGTVRLWRVARQRQIGAPLRGSGSRHERGVQP